jgi:hypothetical protein
VSPWWWSVSISGQCSVTGLPPSCR